MLTIVRIFVAGVMIAATAALPAFAAPSEGTTAAALAPQVFQQRKDVDEVARPQPPSGPATPIPFCSPGSPICP